MWFIILIISGFIIFLLLNALKQQAAKEVIAQGGLRNIFSNLDSILIDEDFEFYNDNVSNIEYRRNIDQMRLLKLMLRKNINDQQPYEMQMFLIVSGSVQTKTIPYLIMPYLSSEQLMDALNRMLLEISIRS